MDKSQNLIWIDLEMTGLKPDTDRIIEIATLVTDADLNILAEGPVLAISQSEQRLACLLYTSPSPRDLSTSRMPSSA